MHVSCRMIERSARVSIQILSRIWVQRVHPGGMDNYFTCVQLTMIRCMHYKHFWHCEDWASRVMYNAISSHLSPHSLYPVRCWQKPSGYIMLGQRMYCILYASIIIGIIIYCHANLHTVWLLLAYFQIQTCSHLNPHIKGGFLSSCIRAHMCIPPIGRES